MENELKKVTVIISGKHIPVNVTSEEETAIREVEKQINEKVQEIQRSYSRQDTEKVLAMATLTLLMQERDQATSFDLDELGSKLDALQHKIDTALKG